SVELGRRFSCAIHSPGCKRTFCSDRLSSPLSRSPLYHTSITPGLSRSLVSRRPELRPGSSRQVPSGSGSAVSGNTSTTSSCGQCCVFIFSDFGHWEWLEGVRWLVFCDFLFGCSEDSAC